MVRDVLAGNRERFAVLVERHGRALLGFLARRTDPESARELFQETLVQSFEGLGRLRDAERLRAWMLSIAHNLLRGERRRRPLRSLDSEPGADGALEVAPTRGPGEREEERARLLAACSRLPPRQREVFELRVVAGLTHAEIAAQLGIREDAARANHYQALRRLRAELEDMT